jgi:hypothetical protein
MVKSKLKVDKRIPIDFLSGFSAKLRCDVGGKAKRISGVNWTITWKNAANLIGKDNVGVNKTLTCKLIVRGRIGTDTQLRDVELKSFADTINIPAPITLNHFKLVNSKKDEITKVATAYPWSTEINAESGDGEDFDRQFYFVQLGIREAERDAAKAALRCAKGFMGSFDKTPPGKRPPGPKRMLGAKKPAADDKKPAAGDKKPAGKKAAPKKMSNAERVKLKEDMFKPKITMSESRKLCNQVAVNQPDNKIPFVNGQFIGCVELIKKDTKQAVRFCDAVNVVSVKLADKPEEVLAAINVADVKVAGHEENPTNRKAAIDNAMDALTILKAMRTPAKDQDDVAGRRLAGKGEGQGGKKKNVPKKAGDKRKKGSPLNQSRIMCNIRCAGTCEQRGLRKTSCTCGEGQHGKWCNTDNNLRTKKNE